MNYKEENTLYDEGLVLTYFVDVHYKENRTSSQESLFFFLLLAMNTDVTQNEPQPATAIIMHRNISKAYR